MRSYTSNDPFPFWMVWISRDLDRLAETPSATSSSLDCGFHERAAALRAECALTHRTIPFRSGWSRSRDSYGAPDPDDDRQLRHRIGPERTPRDPSRADSGPSWTHQHRYRGWHASMEGPARPFRHVRTHTPRIL